MRRDDGSDEPQLQIFACGASTKGCGCSCPDGPCEHRWDGPEWESDDSLASSVTCSRCGMIKMSHDIWVGP